MKNLAARLGLICALAAFAVAGRAHAQLLPIAVNAYGGAGYFHQSLSGGGVSGSSGDFGLNFGADVGYRLIGPLSVVVFGEYDPIFSSPNSSGLFTVGGGLRFALPVLPLQFLVGAGYSSLSVSGASGSASGYGVQAMAFMPWLLWIGPYAEVSYHSVSNSGVTDAMFDVTAGVSFSY